MVFLASRLIGDAQGAVGSGSIDYRAFTEVNAYGLHIDVTRIILDVEVRILVGRIICPCVRTVNMLHLLCLKQMGGGFLFITYINAEVADSTCSKVGETNGVDFAQ